MKHSSRAAASALAMLALAACQTASGSVAEADANAFADAPSFAQAICAGCHAIKPLHVSPDPSAPTFVDIANREGVTRDALARFLSDAHNYPEAMDFDLEPQHVEVLSDYMMTLKEPHYRRSPS